MNIKDNVEIVKERIANAQLRSGNITPIKIVAITKTHPASVILEIRKAGLDTIGENRVQEAEDKFPEIAEILPNITKRLVGHLQSNKINKALNIFDTIDSVDSLKLANKIGSKAVSLNRTIPILLEVNTSGESAKYGFIPENIDEILACFEIPGLEVQGLMTVGPLTSDTNRVRDAFISLRRLYNSIKSQTTKNVDKFTELSMGMSSDFEIAVEEGATMVRLGTVLFGQRMIK
ncbi:YggS family pyridoxal phosphate-dependent enzyme [bacterium]|nr:YggS family pyridoxal phosphate-dependent enzyme [bacterium]